MEEWSEVIRIGGGGFGVTILVLVILALVAWIIGLVAQKAAKKPEETSSKG